MILLFKNDGTYLEQLGTNSIHPAFHEGQWEAVKDDIFSKYKVTEDDLVFVVLDEEDSTNKELIEKISLGYIPGIDVSKATDTNEQEYDVIAIKKVKRLKFSGGKIVKVKGEPVFEEVEVPAKKIRKIFNKNKAALTDVKSWQKSEALLAIEEKKTKRQRVKELERKLLLGEATQAEKDEYKSLT